MVYAVFRFSGPTGLQILGQRKQLAVLTVLTVQRAEPEQRGTTGLQIPGRQADPLW